MANIIISILAILIPLLVGLYYFRRETASDFVCASRKLDVFSGAFSIVSVLGGILLVGQSTLGYQMGYASMWLYIGIAFFLILLSFVAPKIHTFAQECDALTLNEIVKAKVGRYNAFLTSIATFIIFFTILLGNIVIGSTVIAEISGMTFTLSALVVSAVVLIYLLLGGFKVVIKTDFIQFLMFFFIGLFFLLFYKGGGENIPSLFDISAQETISFLAVGLVIFGSVDIIQRITAAKSAKVARKMTLFSAPMFIVMGLVFTLIGISSMGHTIDANSAFMVGLVSSFPAWLTPLGLLMIFAAIMSTIDTELFYLSSSVIRDFGIFKNTHKAERTKKQMLVIMPLILLIALLIAFFSPNILDLLFIIFNIGMALGVAMLGFFLFNASRYSIFLSQILGYGYYAYHVCSGQDPLAAAFPLAIVAFIGLVLGLFVPRKKQN